MFKNPFKKRPDEELMKLMRSGSAIERQRAENEMYDMYREKRVSILRKKGLTKDEAIEVYLKTVEGAFKGILTGNFRGDSTYETYLSRIEENKLKDFLREKYRNQPIDYKDPADLAPLKPSNRPNIEDEIHWKEILDCVRRSAPDGDCLKIFFWKYEGYSHQEIAEKFLAEGNEHYHTAIAVQRRYGRCMEGLIENMKKNCPDLLAILGDF